VACGLPSAERRAGQSHSGGSRMSGVARQFQRGKPGFTLIEVTMVAVLVAILTVIGVAQYRKTIVQRRLLGAVSQILGDLRQMQSSAIAQGRMYRFLDGSAGTNVTPAISPLKPNQYCIQSSTDQGATWTPANPNTGCAWVNLAALFPNPGMGFSIKDSAGTPLTLYEIRFNARGLASNPNGPAFPITLTILTTGETSRQIQVLSTGSTKAL